MTGKPIKGEIMTPAEMVEMGRQKRNTSRIYKAESAQVNNEAISKSVMQGYMELANAGAYKIDLNNTDMVKEISLNYIKACAESSSFPSIAGLARAMGCDRRTLYNWMQRKDSKTSEWLMICHDLFSDILSEAALKNNCNGIMAIFLQKAQYGLSETENVSIQMSQAPSDDYDYVPDNYKDRYRNMIGE